MQEHVHAPDPQHRRVEVEAVEHAAVKMPTLLEIKEHGRVLTAYVLPYGDKETRRPARGSQISSFGPGAVISTIRAMMCRGVRNWPF